MSQCLLAKLQVRGPAGCPRDSRVGRGLATGSYERQPVGAELLLYNGGRITQRRTLLIYIRPDRGVSWVAVSRWSSRPDGLELDIQLPTITILAGTPPPYVNAIELYFKPTFLRARCGSFWSVTGYLITGDEVSTSDRTACP